MSSTLSNVLILKKKENRWLSILTSSFTIGFLSFILSYIFLEVIEGIKPESGSSLKKLMGYLETPVDFYSNQFQKLAYYSYYYIDQMIKFLVNFLRKFYDLSVKSVADDAILQNDVRLVLLPQEMKYRLFFFINLSMLYSFLFPGKNSSKIVTRLSNTVKDLCITLFFLTITLVFFNFKYR